MNSKYLAYSLIAISLCACEGRPNLNDNISVVAQVTLADGATPIPGMHVNNYNINFRLGTSGANIIRSFTGPTTVGATTVPGLLTDTNGQIRFTADASLSRYIQSTRTQCYDTCVSYSTTCEYDPYYGDKYCADSCDWYTTDCYDVDSSYVSRYNFDDVSSTATSITYTSNGTVFTTAGVPVVARNTSTHDADNTELTSAWEQNDKFITPFIALASAAGSEVNAGQNNEALSSPGVAQGMLFSGHPEHTVLRDGVLEKRALTLVGADRAPKMVTIENLTEAQMLNVRNTRDALGIPASKFSRR